MLTVATFGFFFWAPTARLQYSSPGVSIQAERGSNNQTLFPFI